MTIEAGRDWGTPAALGEQCPVFSTDRDLAEYVQRHLDAGGPDPLGAVADAGLLGGDLHRTLGSPRHDEDALRNGGGVRYPIDVGIVRIGEERRVFVAHVLLFGDRRRRWWATRTVAVMNAQFVGELDLAPRGHPNDGRLDVTDGSLSALDRRRAADRMTAGAHVPHPSLAQRRVRRLDISDVSSMTLVVDGVQLAGADRVHVECVPDALRVVA